MNGAGEFLLGLIRYGDAVAIASLVALVIVVRILGNRRSTWIVVLVGLLAADARLRPRLAATPEGRRLSRQRVGRRASIPRKEITTGLGTGGVCPP